MRNHTHIAAIALAAFSFACDGGSDEPTDTDPSGDTGTDPTECIGVASGDSIPEDGDNGFFYRGQMKVEFNGDANAVGATITLADDAGADVPLSTLEWSDDGSVAFFAPASPLSPSTSYTLSAQADCEAATEIGFTTSSLGAAVTTPADLVDSTYELSLANADIVQPPELGSLLGTLLGQLGDTAILFEVSALDETAGTIDFFGGIGEKSGTEITVDPCDPTFGLGSTAGATTSFDNPYFELDAPNGLTLAAAGVEIKLGSVLLSGAFTADGSGIGGARLAGQADARDLAPALGDLLDVGDASGLCTLIGSFGVSCAECESDGEEFCLTIDAQNIDAAKVTVDFEQVFDTDLPEGCE